MIQCLRVQNYIFKWNIFTFCSVQILIKWTVWNYHLSFLFATHPISLSICFLSGWISQLAIHSLELFFTWRSICTSMHYYAGGSLDQSQNMLWGNWCNKSELLYILNLQAVPNFHFLNCTAASCISNSLHYNNYHILP